MQWAAARKTIQWALGWPLIAERYRESFQDGDVDSRDAGKRLWASGTSSREYPAIVRTGGAMRTCRRSQIASLYPVLMGLHRIWRSRRRYRALLRARWWGLIHPGVDVGTAARVGSGCRLFLDPGARLDLGAGCEVDDASTIAVYGDGRIELGPGSFVGHHCTLAAREAIEIGAGTYLAELVSVRDHDHRVGPPPSSGDMTVDPVVIGADVWIGAKVTVLRGARIGEGAVIGANAVVSGEMPARSVCAGVPARVVRMLDQAGD